MDHAKSRKKIAADAGYRLPHDTDARSQPAVRPSAASHVSAALLRVRCLVTRLALERQVIGSAPKLTEKCRVIERVLRPVGDIDELTTAARRGEPASSLTFALLSLANLHDPIDKKPTKRFHRRCHEQFRAIRLTLALVHRVEALALGTREPSSCPSILMRSGAPSLARFGGVIFSTSTGPASCGSAS